MTTPSDSKTGTLPNTKTKMPLVPASIGDVVDRLTILDLKFANLTKGDPRRNHVMNERVRLQQALVEQCGFDLQDLFKHDDVKELAEINSKLWDVEDDIRACMRDASFGDEFVRLARSVPELNDKRSALKYDINKRLDSEIVEVKSYVGFEIGQDG